MDSSGMVKYISENRYSLFIYALLLASMSYFISYVGMTLMTALLFLVIVIMDSKHYRDMKPKYIFYLNMPIDALLGVVLIVLPFANYFFGIFHTTSGFGNIDVTFVLIGITILFYGIKRIWDFYLAVGFVVAIAIFELLMGTALFVDILGPAFIQFTIFFATGILNLFGYNVVAGPNYFILPNGQMIYMLVWCSGIESFTLFTLLMTVLLLREKIKWPVKVILIAVGAIGDLFINVLRVAILVAIAIDYGMSMMELFHSNLGDLLFLAYVILFYWAVIKYVVGRESENAGQTDD